MESQERGNATAASEPIRWRQRVYALVRQIPRGRVATYGQLAALAGRPRAARQVGQALAALDASSDVPWHRVVNAQGRISRRADGDSDRLQRYALEDEGVVFSVDAAIDLRRYQWRPVLRPPGAGTGP
ncbi:MAG: MGMT family protein [Gammaproteobacteria bacterium]|nr:MAG: MGMT family protein [Gammaproteobacteria bacterium]